MEPVRLEGSEDINYPCPIGDLESKVVCHNPIGFPLTGLFALSGADMFRSVDGHRCSWKNSRATSGPRCIL